MNKSRILICLICLFYSFELLSQSNLTNIDSFQVKDDNYYAKFMVEPEYAVTKTKNQIVGIATDFNQFYGLTFDYKLAELRNKGNINSDLIWASSIAYSSFDRYLSGEESIYNQYSGPSISSAIKLSTNFYYVNIPFSLSFSALLGASYQHYNIKSYKNNYTDLLELNVGYIAPTFLIGLSVNYKKIPISMGCSLGINYGTGVFYYSVMYGL